MSDEWSFAEVLEAHDYLNRKHDAEVMSHNHAKQQAAQRQRK